MTKFISFALPDDAEIVSWPLWGFSGEVEYDDATEVKTWEQLGAKWVSIDGCSWSVAAEGYPHGKLEARVQRSKSDSWNVTLYHPTDRWGSKSFYIGETDLEARLFIQTLQEMPQEL